MVIGAILQERVAAEDWSRSSKRGDRRHLRGKLLTIELSINVVFLLDKNFYLTKPKLCSIIIVIKESVKAVKSIRGAYHCCNFTDIDV